MHFDALHFPKLHFDGLHFPPIVSVVAATTRRPGARLRYFYEPTPEEQKLDDEEVIILAIGKFLDQLII